MSRALQRAAPFVIAAAALAAYASSLWNGFAWDDGYIIVGAPRLPLFEVLLSRDEAGSYYRPLNRASYLLDERLFGMHAAGFHAVNLGLHVAACVLLYFLALRLFDRRPFPALVAALLLAVHPVCSEPVLFISGRNNLFATVFVLASLLFALRGSDVLSAVAFLLGLMSKEPAAMALPLLLVLHRSPRRLVPHLVAASVYAVLRIISLNGPGLEVRAGLGERLIADLSFVPAYLALTLWPSGLTIFHEPPHLGWPMLLLSWTAIAAGVVAILRWRSPAARFGLVWFALSLVPIANLVPIPSAPFAERYFYAPAAGLCIIAAAAWELLPAAAGVAVAVAVLVPLSVRSAIRTRDWRDDVALCRSAVAVHPESALARRNLADTLKVKGDFAGALEQWEEAIRLAPNDPETLTQLGTLAAVQGDFALAERRYRAAIALGQVPLAHFNLARICERTSRPTEALDHYRAFVGVAGSVEREEAAVARERIAALTR
jgi:hypothetical protein